jgi:hypothetical protein
MPPFIIATNHAFIDGVVAPGTRRIKEMGANHPNRLDEFAVYEQVINIVLGFST